MVAAAAGAIKQLVGDVGALEDGDGDSRATRSVLCDRAILPPKVMLREMSGYCGSQYKSEKQRVNFQLVS